MPAASRAAGATKAADSALGLENLQTYLETVSFDEYLLFAIGAGHDAWPLSRYPASQLGVRSALETDPDMNFENARHLIFHRTPHAEACRACLVTGAIPTSRAKNGERKGE